ncbi:MAG: hypothetical protein OXG60_17295 [Chloroflexi bacterium]|nr:hypothetical protein [Chloroflexota bacterium]
MTWTAPKTDWSNGDLVTADDLNAIGENLAAVRNLQKASGATTAHIRVSTHQFADVDSDNLNLTITTTGGDVLAHFHGAVRNHFSDGAYHCYFDVEVDGSRQGDSNGIMISTIDESHRSVSFTHLIQNLGAGSHTFKLQWREDGASRQSVWLYIGAQFWAREI